MIPNNKALSVALCGGSFLLGLVIHKMFRRHFKLPAATMQVALEEKDLRIQQLSEELRRAQSESQLLDDRREAEAEQQQDHLPEQQALAVPPPVADRKRPIRVYFDGCFDMMHYGHANALRQAKALGDILVVGVCSDETIISNKGPPIMNVEERCVAVAACKWVDKVIKNTPYNLTPEFIQYLFEEHKIDYIVHGDDACLLPDGTDAYAEAKRLGRFKPIKRTEGVSSTDLVKRCLETMRVTELVSPADLQNDEHVHLLAEPSSPGDLVTTVTSVLPTTRRITQFSSGKAPKPGDRVIYTDGTWDLFHVGHILFLEKAKQLGDFLIVGVHDDYSVKSSKGVTPMQSLHERALSVLSCKYVDEVVIGAPWAITNDMIVTLNISKVVKGTFSDLSYMQELQVPCLPANLPDPYRVPKERGILVDIPSPSNMSEIEIIRRIRKNEGIVQKVKAKTKKEQEYLANKTYVAEI